MKRRLVLQLTAAGLAAGVAWAAELPASLIEAAKRSDKTTLRQILKPGVNVNAAEGDGSTALLWAAYRDDLESADLLIRAGANVNAANDVGVTPLWAASENGSATMVKKLLAAGANPSAKLASGETVVMTAARAGKTEVVELLAAKGADLNAKAMRGQTALMWAIAQRHPDTVKVLLAHKADVNIRTDVWTQLWQTAPDQDVHPDYQTNIKYGGDTAILFAARYGDLESAKLLVAAGANVNDESAYGANTAVLAAHSGNPELLQFLLDKDANPNAAKAGYTALHAAILRGDTKAVEVLLNHGADANAKLMASTPVRRDSLDYYYHPGFVGATPFWLAARFSQPAMMRLLAAHGADPGYVHTVSFWGRRGKDSKYTRVAPTKVTPMLAALGMGGLNSVRAPLPSEREAIALESIKIAVEAGAPVDAADQDGRTALEVATALRYKSVIDYLTSKGAKLDRPARPLPRVRVEEN